MTTQPFDEQTFDERAASVMNQIADLMTMREAVRITITSTWNAAPEGQLYTVDVRLEVGDETNMDEAAGIIAAPDLVTAFEEMLQEADQPTPDGVSGGPEQS